MREASKEFRDHVENDGYVYQVGKITFANGITRNLLASDFYVSGNEWSEGAGTSTFPVGETIAKAVTICLVNDDDRFSTYDFYNAVIEIYAAAMIDGVEHRCMIGTYTVHEPESYGAQVTVHAIDDMHKADVPYTTNMTYPATVEDILADSCRTLGVPLETLTFANSDYVIAEKPAEMTHRQLWGLIAMLAAGCARMDEHNHLHIISYDLSFFSRDSLDGGIFDAQSPYATGDSADGGNFVDYSSGDEFDGGTFEELTNFHIFSKADTPTIATDDVIITGVRITVGEERFLYGSEGYVLALDNQLLSSDPADGVSRIGKLIIGMRFRPFSLAHTNYPFVEFGDICYVTDRKGNYYQSVVTDIAYIFLGKTSISCSADSPLRNSSTYNSEAAKQTAKLTQETFKAVEQINENIEEINDEIEEIDENIGQLHVSLKKTDEGLSAEVSRALGAEGSLSSRIDLTDSSITAEVSRATGAEGTLQSQYAGLSIRADGIESTVSSKVGNNEIISKINQSAEAVSILASKINLEGVSNFTNTTSDGTVTISGAQVYISNSTRSVDNVGGIAVTNGVMSSGVGYDGILVKSGSSTYCRISPTDIYFMENGSYSRVLKKNQTISFPESSGTYGTQATKYAVRSIESGSTSCTANLALNYEGASDVRIKKNVNPLPDLKSLYMSIHPISYEYAATCHLDGVRYGFDALEIEKELLNIGITEKDTTLYVLTEPDPYSDEAAYVGDDKVRSLNYDEFHALHVQMIQSQQKEIEHLKTELGFMQMQLYILQQELEDLKNVK